MTPEKYPPKLLRKNKTKKFEIQNLEPQKVARAYVCMKISECTPPPPPPPPPGDKRTDRHKMKNQPSSQICNFKHLFLFGIPHKSAC